MSSSVELESVEFEEVEVVLESVDSVLVPVEFVEDSVLESVEFDELEVVLESVELDSDELSLVAVEFELDESLDESVVFEEVVSCKKCSRGARKR